MTRHARRASGWKRTLSATAAIATLSLGITGITVGFGEAAPAQAAQGLPFDCSTPRFFAQAEADDVLQLYTGGYDRDGDSVWTRLGAERSGASLYNAAAFNPKDNYIYGTYYGQTSGSTVQGSFVRIDRDGNLTPIGNANTALGRPANSLWDNGEFDPDGNYYVASGNAGTNTIYKISGLKDAPGTTPTRSTITLTGVSNPRFADLAYIDGYLWAANYNQSATLYRIDPASGATRSFNVSSIIPTSGYGSGFRMTNGNFAIIGTGGRMYQIDITNPSSTSPTFDLISDVGAPTNAKSNATNCSTAEKASLSVTKTGPATVVIGHTIEWTITVKNEGRGNTSGFVLVDTLPNDLADLKVTSTDTACVITGTTSKKATCNGGYLANGATATVTVRDRADDPRPAHQQRLRDR